MFLLNSVRALFHVQLTKTDASIIRTSSQTRNFLTARLTTS